MGERRGEESIAGHLGKGLRHLPRKVELHEEAERRQPRLGANVECRQQRRPHPGAEGLLDKQIEDDLLLGGHFEGTELQAASGCGEGKDDLACLPRRVVLDAEVGHVAKALDGALADRLSPHPGREQKDVDPGRGRHEAVGERVAGGEDERRAGAEPGADRRHELRLHLVGEEHQGHVGPGGGLNERQDLEAVSAGPRRRGLVITADDHGGRVRTGADGIAQIQAQRLAEEAVAEDRDRLSAEQGGIGVAVTKQARMGGWRIQGKPRGNSRAMDRRA